MPKPIAVLVNARAGTAEAEECDALCAKLAALFEAAGLKAQIEFPPAEKLGEAARRLAARARAGEFEAVVAGGGDGSVSAVAGALADTGVPFGILPLGTLNHFARDLGLPAALEAAILTVAAGETRDVDAAEVNGELFVNNASIGVYPFMVLDRDRRRAEHGLKKWTAMAFAIVRTLWQFPRRRLRIAIKGESAPHKTPLVFVGNNEYRLSPPALGERARLDGGQLWVCVARREGRPALLWLAVRALFGRLDRERDLSIARVESFEIHSRASRLLVALDGDVQVMRPPLCFRARPMALKVLAGPREETTQ